MAAYSKNSYLSFEVKKLLCHPYDLCLVSISPEQFEESLFIDLNQFTHILDISDLKNSDYQAILVSVSKKISPYINHLTNISDNVPEKIFPLMKTIIIEYSKLIQYIEDSCSGNEAFNFINLLEMTADLEHSLGNILLLKNAFCPNMLKDILTSEIILDLIPKPLIDFMQVLLGPNTSLNLRNLAWHGYLTASELNPFLIKLLILCIVNWEKHLTSIESIEIRSKISLVPLHSYLATSFCSVMDDNVLLKELFTLFEIHPISRSGSILCKSYKYLQTLLEKNKYYDSVILMLPLIEHLLRCEFCTANSLPDHWLNARHNVFFITLDEMLSKTFSLDGTQSVSNQLVSILPESILTAMHDLFIFPDGPRLRDRISHGELDKTSVNANVVDAILNMFVSILLLYPSIKHEQTVSNLDTSIKSKLGSYQSHYHPIGKLRLTTLDFLCLSIDFLKIIDETNVQIVCCIAFSFHLSNQILGTKFTDKLIDKSVKDYFENEIKSSLLKPVSVLYRGNEIIAENDKTLQNFTSILQLIVSEFYRFMNQVIVIYKERRSQIENHSLRSRQRSNFEKLENCLPEIVDFSFEIIAFTSVCLDLFIRNISINNPSCESNFLNKKQWKSVILLQQAVDKIESLCIKSKWNEIVECIRTLKE